MSEENVKANAAENVVGSTGEVKKNRAEFLKDVEEMLREHLDLSSDDQIKEETSIVDELGADSLDVVELIMKMENKFGVKISDEEAKKLKTVKDVVDMVVEKSPEAKSE